MFFDRIASKTMKIAIGLTFAALALSGCAGYQRPGTSPAEAETDRRDCDHQADMAQPGMSDADYFRRGELLAKCMNMKGYR